MMEQEASRALEERAAARLHERERVKTRVAKLLGEGLTRVEIMSRLGISSGYYYRLVGEIRAAVRAA